MGPAAGVTRHAAKLAAAIACAALVSSCAFRGDVTVGGVADAGSDSGGQPSSVGGGGTSPAGAAGAPASGGSASTPFAGSAGVAPSAGVGGSAGDGSTAPAGACGLGAQAVAGFVTPRDSPEPMNAGMGGLVMPGTYRLIELVEHGSCGCFDANAPLQQTLVLNAETGFLISDTANGGHWAATFRYATHGNAFEVEPICSELASGTPAPDPFGVLATYTVSANSLRVMSPACQYRAVYERLNDSLVP